MPDLLGHRAKMAVVVPSTNWTMEPELHVMAPRGVTVHTARLRLAQGALRSSEEARAAISGMQSGLEVAIREVTTAEPDHLLIGVSALSFMNGLAGSQSFEEFVA